MGGKGIKTKSVKVEDVLCVCMCVCGGLYVCLSVCLSVSVARPLKAASWLPDSDLGGDGASGGGSNEA